MRTELRDAIVGAPDMDISAVFDTVYDEITPELARQRDQLLVELGKDGHDSDHRTVVDAR